MKRREFIGLLGAAAGWPLAARAQPSGLPVIGYLYPGVPELSASLVSAFRRGLGEAGLYEGRTVAVEYHFAYNDYGRLRELSADLVARRVAVIVAPGGPAAALAAKSATTTIPIVFSMGGDPVERGLVASLAHPGGNITGISSLNFGLSAKRLGLLHELLPGAKRFAALIDANNTSGVERITKDLREAASAIGRQIEVIPVSTNREIEKAFTSIVETRVDALLVSPSPFLENRRAQIVTLAAYHRLPTSYSFRDYVDIGGLMSYGSSASERDRLVGIYVARILRGEKPAELPVIQASKFELVINQQTARLLGIVIPPTLLAIADEVIE
jgi:putative tryptophan/tyrosine transport system substrate-binding protein